MFDSRFDMNFVQFGVVLYSRGVQVDKSIPFDFSYNPEVLENEIRDISYAPSGPGNGCGIKSRKFLKVVCINDRNQLANVCLVKGGCRGQNQMVN